MTDIAPAPRIVKRRFAKFGPWALLIIIVAAAVSFFAVSQLRTSNRFSEELSSENEGDLARILASLSSESTAQQQQLAILKVELANLQNASTAQGTASAAVTSQLNSLQVLSGTVPVSGPGLEVDIADPKHQVTYDVVVDTIEELRDAGAEALAVNGQRVGVASFFGSTNNSNNVNDGGEITLNNVALTVPYTITAIGPASTMEGGLQIPGGSLDTLRALNSVTADVKHSNTLTLPALAYPPTFKSAKPVTQ